MAKRKRTSEREGEREIERERERRKINRKMGREMEAIYIPSSILQNFFSSSLTLHQNKLECFAPVHYTV